LCTGSFSEFKRPDKCRVLAKFSGAQFDLQWIRQINDSPEDTISYMDFSQDGSMLATISEKLYIIMLFNTTSGDIIRSINIMQNGYMYWYKLKSVVLGNNASDTSKPLLYVYSSFWNARQLFGAITAIKPHVS
jgi:WD40 repeat protein